MKYYPQFSLFVLLVPTLLLPFTYGDNKIDIQKSEQRPIVEFSDAISTAAFSRATFEKAYEDNFPLRSVFFKLISRFKLNFLHVSFSEKSVVLGKEGWLFLGDQWGNELSRLMNRQEVSQEEINRWARDISSLGESMREKGISFRFMIAPNKSSVYSSKLPNYFFKNKKHQYWPKNAALKENRFVIFPLEEIQSESRQTYYKFDSHWNNLGAGIAFEVLYQSLMIERPLLKRRDIRENALIYKNQTDEFDLSNMLYMGAQIDTKFEFINSEKVSISDCPRKPRTLTNPKYLNDQTVLFVCDSFGSGLIPYFFKSFKNVTYLHSDSAESGAFKNGTKLLEGMNFDIVIVEMVERKVARKVF